MSKPRKFVGKEIEIEGQRVQFDDQGNLLHCGDEKPEYCDLICTKKEVAAIVKTARAFEVAAKLERKIKLTGDFELSDHSDDEYGINVGCTFVPYEEIIRIFGRMVK